MKALLILTWLGIAGAGYFGYTFYRQSTADLARAQQELGEAHAANHELTGKVATLTQQLSDAHEQLDARERAYAALQSAERSSPAPAPAVAAPAEAPSSIPSTITTLMGKTYTGCILSRVTPDGISFTHSQGVAKVQFSDLDPALAATFGYDPAAAKKYEAVETAQQAGSDAARAETEARDKAAPAVVTPGAPGASPATQEQIAALQSQIATLQKEADALDAAELFEFNSAPNIYYSSTGDLEHRHTLGHSQQAVDDRAAIQQLQAQIGKLEGDVTK